MEFEWDEKKSESNTEKHGISFEEARALFSDSETVSYSVKYPAENRYILVGHLNGKIWAACYTMRGSVIRMISVRRARKKEEKLHV